MIARTMIARLGHRAASRLMPRLMLTHPFSGAPRLHSRKSKDPLLSLAPPAPTAKLIKQLEKEIKFTKEKTVSGEDGTVIPSLENVEKEWASFLREGGWTVTTAEGQSVVELARSTNGYNVLVRFNIQEVMSSNYNESGEYEDDLEAGGEETEAGTEDDWSPNLSDFAVSVEIARPGQVKQKLVAECNAAINEDGSDYLAVENVHLEPLETSGRAPYTGPDFGSLDEDLQQQFEAFVSSQVNGGRLIEFIRAYAEAKENAEYEAWLGRVKSLLA